MKLPLRPAPVPMSYHPKEDRRFFIDTSWIQSPTFEGQDECSLFSLRTMGLRVFHSGKIPGHPCGVRPGRSLRSSSLNACSRADVIAAGDSGMDFQDPRTWICRRSWLHAFSGYGRIEFTKQFILLRTRNSFFHEASAASLISPPHGKSVTYTLFRNAFLFLSIRK